MLWTSHLMEDVAREHLQQLVFLKCLFPFLFFLQSPEIMDCVYISKTLWDLQVQGTKKECKFFPSEFWSMYIYHQKSRIILVNIFLHFHKYRTILFPIFWSFIMSTVILRRIDEVWWIVKINVLWIASRVAFMVL